MVSCHLVPTCHDVDTGRLVRQREEGKHRKREKRDAARRERERRSRERAAKRELRDALERDR